MVVGMVTGKTVAMAAEGSVVLLLGMEVGAMARMVAATAVGDWVVLVLVGMVEGAGAGMSEDLVGC